MPHHHLEFLDTLHSSGHNILYFGIMVAFADEMPFISIKGAAIFNVKANRWKYHSKYYTTWTG